MARERWTDERLDECFNRVDADILGLRMEMRKGFEQIDKRFDQIDRRFEQVDKRFERVDDKFDAMQRNMTLWSISIFSTIVVSLITVVVSLA